MYKQPLNLTKSCLNNKPRKGESPSEHTDIKVDVKTKRGNYLYNCSFSISHLNLSCNKSLLGICEFSNNSKTQT